ncbi:MAG: hypothetical protein IAE95_04810 [Chitinophagaceae bacterium]|nr:hypothetical protein [Chitinophagaceae bacterium]
MLLVSRRKFSFYIGIFFVVLFYWGYGSIIFAVSLDEGTNYLMLALALFFYFMGGYTLRFYVTHTPIVRFSDEGITLRGRMYGWSRVHNVALSGKQPFRYARMRHEMDAMTIRFDDGTSLFIFDKMYRNTAAMRNLLQDRINGRTVAEELKPEPSANEPVISETARKRMMRRVTLFGIAYSLGIMALVFLYSFLQVPETVTILLKIAFVLATFGGAIYFRKFMTKLIRRAEEETRNGM